ncbi:MAG: DUF2996 domain-containing protein [Leptolyngbyaceae cyanobacterium bins.59]|nr:DUF2996 domain-containing protein [Leptolyngbyaceae cyanobacterium bins.59]
MADPQNHNEAGEVAPSTVDQQAPAVSEENAPGTSSPESTSLPSANTPAPTTANPEVNPNAAAPKAKKVAKGDQGMAGDEPGGEKPEEAAAKPAREKKEKAPALESKPFADFIQQDYLPTLEKALVKLGVEDLYLSFEKQKINVVGFSQEPECWQVVGCWNSGRRQFNVYFLKEDIQGQRAFSYADRGSKPSTLEPFLIDERKVTLDLLVFGILQRLTAQKWLVRN